MSTFSMSRQTTVAAPPAAIHPLLVDFRRWRAWSPWEDADPDLERTYSGAESGVGARYAWAGNRKAGRGSMEIVQAATHRVEVRLAFEKPMRMTNTVVFDLDEVPEGTRVAWTMSGERTGLPALLARVLPVDAFMEKAVGGDFEKGLARLKVEAEAARG